MDKKGESLSQTILQKKIANDIAGRCIDGGGIFCISIILYKAIANWNWTQSICCADGIIEATRKRDQTNTQVGGIFVSVPHLCNGPLELWVGIEFYWSDVVVLFVCVIFRGIRFKDYDLYNPVVRNIFFCIESGKAIPIERLNDDYCDCEEDGSDEPETNACTNGLFYCTYQKR